MELFHASRKGDLNVNYYNSYNCKTYYIICGNALRNLDLIVIRKLLLCISKSNYKEWINLLDPQKHIHLKLLKHNPIIVSCIMDTLIPFVDKSDENIIRHMLIVAIMLQFDVNEIQMIDRLWAKSTKFFKSTDENLKLKLIYSTCMTLKTDGYSCSIWLDNSTHKYNDDDIIKQVYRIGVHRHINALCVVSQRMMNVHNLDKYTENALNKLSLSKVIDYVPMLDITKTNTSQAWYDKMKFISTTTQSSSEIPYQSEDTVIKDISLVLSYMNEFDKSIEKRNVLEAIDWLFGEIKKEVIKIDITACFYPILVGSAAESTQSYLPNEFDFVLYFKNNNRHNSLFLSYTCRKYRRINTIIFAK